MIGIFDSGLGGLTALREAVRLLPGRDIVYFGDTGRLPYGTKSPATIVKYALQDMRFLTSVGGETTRAIFNKNGNIKKNLPSAALEAVLAACGTVSSTALGNIRAEFRLPVFGVIESAVRRAAEVTKNKKVGIIATPAAVASRAYQSALNAADSEIIPTATPCPLLVPLVENGYIDAGNRVTRLVLDDYLREIDRSGADTLILGCTHFPLIAPAIAAALPNVILINSGAEAAAELAGGLRDKAPAEGESGRVTYYVSDNPENFRSVASIFFGGKFEGDINVVDIENY